MFRRPFVGQQADAVKVVPDLPQHVLPPSPVRDEFFLVKFALREVQDLGKFGGKIPSVRGFGRDSIDNEALEVVGMMSYEKGESFPALVGGQLVAVGEFLKTGQRVSFNLFTSLHESQVPNHDIMVGGIDEFMWGRIEEEGAGVVDLPVLGQRERRALRVRGRRRDRGGAREDGIRCPARSPEEEQIKKGAVPTHGRGQTIRAPELLSGRTCR